MIKFNSKLLGISILIILMAGSLGMNNSLGAPKEIQGKIKPTLGQNKPDFLKQRMKIIIPTQGMNCLSCVGQITNTLKSIEGVSNVEVNLLSRYVLVEYLDDPIFPEILSVKINSLGYKTSTPAFEKK